MKFHTILAFNLLVILITSCTEAIPVCPTPSGVPNRLALSSSDLPTPTPASGIYQVAVGKSTLQFDKVVEGPLCNDTWSGMVYVKCNVQVYPWTEEPTFLKNCQLDIKPQTVVYVAYHNDTAYYNGCSCHTGITPEP